MITKQKISACVSMIGQYGIQYPNHEAVSVMIPARSVLTALSWIGGGDWHAFTWERDFGVAVVWIEKHNL